MPSDPRSGPGGADPRITESPGTQPRRVVLWDFDGTLADSLRLALAVYNRLASVYGFRPVVDPPAVRDMTMRQFMKSHGVPVWRVPQLFAEFLRSMSRAESVKLVPGAVATLRQLAESGYRQGVVSSNSTTGIRKCLEEHAVAGCFEIIAGTSRLFGKQHRLKQALRELGATPANVLYVGDEVRDIEAGNASGLAVVAVTWGLNSRDILVKHQPAFVVDSFAELREQVELYFRADQTHSR